MKLFWEIQLVALLEVKHTAHKHFWKYVSFGLNLSANPRVKIGTRVNYSANEWIEYPHVFLWSLATRKQNRPVRKCFELIFQINCFWPTNWLVSSTAKPTRKNSFKKQLDLAWALNYSRPDIFFKTINNQNKNMIRTPNWRASRSKIKFQRIVQWNYSGKFNWWLYWK